MLVTDFMIVWSFLSSADDGQVLSSQHVSRLTKTPNTYMQITTLLLLSNLRKAPPPTYTRHFPSFSCTYQHPRPNVAIGSTARASVANVFLESTYDMMKPLRSSGCIWISVRDWCWSYLSRARVRKHNVQMMQRKTKRRILNSVVIWIDVRCAFAPVDRPLSVVCQVAMRNEMVIRSTICMCNACSRTLCSEFDACNWTRTIEPEQRSLIHSKIWRHDRDRGVVMAKLCAPYFLEYYLYHTSSNIICSFHCRATSLRRTWRACNTPNSSFSEYAHVWWQCGFLCVQLTLWITWNVHIFESNALK